MRTKAIPPTEPPKMRKVYGYLVSTFGYSKGGQIFWYYHKRYGLWMDDVAPVNVVYEVFGMRRPGGD